MWKTVKIGDVCDVTNGSTPLRNEKKYWENGRVRWFTIDDLRAQGKDITHTLQNVTQAAVNDKKVRLVPANSVLLCCTASIGEVAIARVEMATNQQFNSLTPKFESLNSDYLYYVATTLKKWLLNVSGSTTINFVSMGKLKEISIPLPPLAEQQRIVAKLDAAFAEIDKAVMSTESKLNVLEELFEGYVARQFEHKDNQEIKKLKEVCEKITDGTHQTPKYFDDGYIFLSSKNVTSRKIDWDNIKYVDDIQHNEMQRRLSPQLGDVLLAKNGTTGVAAMVDRDVKFNIYVSLACLRTKGDVLPAYLLHFVNSKVAREQFSIRTKGIGVPNLHLQEIREVEISFPASHSEQELVIRKIESFRDNYSLINELLKVKVKSLQLLKSSILTQALQPPPQQ